MKGPILAPRPTSPVVSLVPKPQSVLAHSDLEWATVYPEIERLYVRERRKLRHVMQYMESEHGFKATEQMYKKRFTKWGFQKNSRRSTATVHPLKTKGVCRRVANRKSSPATPPVSMPAVPGFHKNDGLTLLFLTSVRTWNAGFFDSVQFSDGFLASQQSRLLTGPPRLSNSQEINFAFKLVINLLDRGHGDLAGRMARKAFLLVEDMLTLEPPVLLWNLLDMMHYMVTLGHAQLFHILLAHLIALADGQMPESHPFPTMLRGLWRLTASLGTLAPTSSNSLSSSSVPCSFDHDGTTTNDNPWLLSRVLQSLLEQAWTLNAEIFFNNFDPRLFPLYFRVPWDSCSISFPATVVGTAGQWFSQIEAQQMLIATAMAHLSGGQPANTAVEEDRLMGRLLTPRMDASPPQDYEMLRTSSIAALQERADSIFGKAPTFNREAALLLRMLAGLATAKVLDGSPAAIQQSGTADFMTTKVPRLHAGNVACAIRTLLDLAAENGGDDTGSSLGDAERIRAIVALRGYADGETAPQVVREMWLLQDALVAAGEYGEAKEVERDAYRRMEKYIQDIPVDSV